ncbi:MAG: PAS domain S-box protein, partial [Deltaproteobacteria bacterium]|nr:PAS domain S-box protein [Deltaproteobacteria bacterium]
MPGATILIVEDEILIAEDLKNKLKQAGYQDVATAASGEEALRLAAVRSPDLVLMDIRLSGRLDGIQAAEALNAGQQTAIIYLTAFANDEIIERAKKTRPCGYLLKPYSELELRTNIEMALYRMEAEKKLQESEERFRAIAESSHDAIMISDRDGTIIYVNNAARAVFGYDARELLGASDRCLVAGPLQGRHVEARERAGVHGMSDVLGRTVESLARKKDGTEFPIEMSVSSWEAGGQRHFSITVRDITRRKLAEEELKVQARNLEEVNAALKVL